MNTTIMHSISKALDMEDLVVESDSVPVVTEPSKFELTPQEKEADTDFSKARNALTDALNKGMEALNSAVLVATNSQKPSGYDSVSSLLKEVTDATQKLMNLHDARRTLVGQENDNKESAVSGGALIGNAQNVIVVKNPAELSKLMRKMRDDRQE